MKRRSFFAAVVGLCLAPLGALAARRSASRGKWVTVGDSTPCWRRRRTSSTAARDCQNEDMYCQRTKKLHAFAAGCPKFRWSNTQGKSRGSSVWTPCNPREWVECACGDDWISLGGAGRQRTVGIQVNDKVAMTIHVPLPE